MQAPCGPNKAAIRDALAPSWWAGGSSRRQSADRGEPAHSRTVIDGSERSSATPATLWLFGGVIFFTICSLSSRLYWAIVILYLPFED